MDDPTVLRPVRPVAPPAAGPVVPGTPQFTPAGQQTGPAYPVDAKINKGLLLVLPLVPAAIVYLPQTSNFALYQGTGVRVEAGGRPALGPVAFSLNFAPAPFGYVPPGWYDLSPGYLAKLVPILPQSHYLASVPETDVSVQKERARIGARPSYRNPALEQLLLLPALPFPSRTLDLLPAPKPAQPVAGEFAEERTVRQLQQADQFIQRNFPPKPKPAPLSPPNIKLPDNPLLLASVAGIVASQTALGRDVFARVAEALTPGPHPFPTEQERAARLTPPPGFAESLLKLATYGDFAAADVKLPGAAAAANKDDGPPIIRDTAQWLGDP